MTYEKCTILKVSVDYWYCISCISWSTDLEMKLIYRVKPWLQQCDATLLYWRVGRLTTLLHCILCCIIPWSNVGATFIGFLTVGQWVFFVALTMLCRILPNKVARYCKDLLRRFDQGLKHKCLIICYSIDHVILRKWIVLSEPQQHEKIIQVVIQVSLLCGT